MENRQNPHKRGSKSNSNKLCTVELIHLRRCDKKTFHSAGTTVLHFASAVNLSLHVGNDFIMSVVSYSKWEIKVVKIDGGVLLGSHVWPWGAQIRTKRSSPKASKFFLCRVST